MGMTRWVSRLIYANAVVFLITYYAIRGIPTYFALIPAVVLTRPWTIVTYMFLHAGWMHLIFNMLGLFFFGPRLEQRLGEKHFLGLYFASGITGGLLSILNAFINPVVSSFIPIVGASGAIFGIFLAFAMYWPREQIYIWGVLPVQARVLVGVMTALSLFGGFGAMQGGVAHFAHLGGFVGGYFYIKWTEHNSPAKKFKRKLEAPARSPGGEKSDLKRWESIRRDEMHPVNRDELDRVIEKISTSGIGSLTPDERAFLDRFAQR
jgi:membrane associated rhomboid family serine protease